MVLLLPARESRMKRSETILKRAKNHHISYVLFQVQALKYKVGGKKPSCLELIEHLRRYEARQVARARVTDRSSLSEMVIIVTGYMLSQAIVNKSESVLY